MRRGQIWTLKHLPRFRILKVPNSHRRSKGNEMLFDLRGQAANEPVKGMVIGMLRLKSGLDFLAAADELYQRP